MDDGRLSSVTRAILGSRDSFSVAPPRRGGELDVGALPHAGARAGHHLAGRRSRSCSLLVVMLVFESPWSMLSEPLEPLRTVNWSNP